ncbi:MAG: ATP-binding protein [Oscillospiraceae bacterium]|nr:ATP-binding protein [Oscillospiraceae bacterium]
MNHINPNNSDPSYTLYDLLVLAFNSAPMAITIYKTDFKPMYCNDEAVRMFGYKDRFEYLKNYQNTFPEFQPDGRKTGDIWNEKINEAFKHGASKHDFVLRHKDATEFHARCEYLSAKYDSNTEVIIEYSTDITATMEAKEKEKLAHMQSEIFFEKSPFVMNIWDEDLVMLKTSQKAVELFELDSQETYIERFNELSPETQPCGTPSDVKAAYFVRQAFFTDKPVVFEWMHKKLNGELIPSEITLVRYNLNETFYVAAYTVDLRQVKEATKKEQVAIRENVTKSRFLAQVSHEMRTPLNSVLGVCEIQLKSIGLTDRSRDAFNRIYNSAHMLITLINNLLDISKVAEGKMELVSRKYSIPSLIVDIIQINVVTVGSKPIRFSAEIDPKLPSEIIGDELRTKQVVNNVLSNAIKYTENGEVKFSVECVESHIGKALLRFRVSDTGRGMTQEQISRLFDEYIRFDEEKHVFTEGSGLGMAITHRLVKMMGGEISVKSSVDKGTVVELLLPQEVTGSEVIGKEQAERLGSTEDIGSLLRDEDEFSYEPMPYGKVLVVDDMEGNLFVAKGLISIYEIEVETASSGFDALKLIQSGNEYDIIFMDHMMPEMDGVETLKKMKEIGCEFPIVALTANAFVGQHMTFMQEGFSGYISKPINTKILDKCLKKFIRDKYPDDAQKIDKPDVSNTASVKVTNTNSLEYFLRDAQNALRSLKEIMERDSLDSEAIIAYTIHMHTMKSLLLSIGEPEASGTAATLEAAGKDRDIDTIKKSTPDFIATFEEITKKLEIKVAGIKSEHDDLQWENNQTDNSKTIHELLKTLSKACREYDVFITNSIVDDLIKNTVSEEIKKLVDEIDSLLLCGEFEEVEKLIESHLAKESVDLFEPPE